MGKISFFMKKYISISMAAMVICLCCMRPVTVLAAVPPQEGKKVVQITPISIVLFYAGVVGLIVGISTGWMNALFGDYSIGKKKTKQEETENQKR